MPYIDGNTSGWKRTDTSHKAAASVRPAAHIIREKVIAQLELQHPYPLTTEQIVTLTGLAYESVQPRVSELRNLGILEDSTIRRMGRFGKLIAAWRLAPAHAPDKSRTE